MKAKQRKQRRTHDKRRVTFAPIRIDVSTEEILADLHYPASRNGRQV